MTDLERIDRQFAEIAALLEGGDALLGVRAPKVSGWSIGQQLDHVLHGAQAVFSTLTGGGKEPAAGINWTGRLLLTLGWFPRGVAKSPKSALPSEAPDAAELAAKAAHLRAGFRDLAYRTGLLASRQLLFKHPYFGGLDCRQTLRFLGVHNHHHLKIVRDIRRAGRPAG